MSRTHVVSPAELSSLRDLELVARTTVEGMRQGLHRSPFHGYSAEFSQYRHYRPGDDLKYVDWKLVARTDRVYTKQFRETTNMAASLVVDTSASMAFPGASAGDGARRWGRSSGELTKFRYAVVLAAALAHLVSRQGDGVGLLAAGEAGAFLPPLPGRSHLGRVLATLSSLEPAGAWSGAETIRRAAERLTRRGVVIVMSDFYD